MPPIIEVSHVSKEFRLGHERRRSETFGELAMRSLGLSKSQMVKPKIAAQTFWALEDVSFNVAEGEVIGIIGRNGAGKSTLLKILSRITDPTRGVAHLRGRMASLLEVGTGFHPELTGRENIYLNGAILGLRRAEIRAKFDEIVAFSEVSQFLETPVKHYSSGMYLRLAFSVAANLNPEILVIDEVLAVGDMAFQKKCLGKMNEVSREGRTVLFVSHHMATVENLCQRGIVLDQGKVSYDGPVKVAIQHYIKSASGMLGRNSHVVDVTDGPNRKSPLGRFLHRVELFTDGEQPLDGGIPIGASLKLRVHFDLPGRTDSFNIGVGFNNLFGQAVFTAHSCFEPERSHGMLGGRQVFVCTIPSLTLVPGEYSIFLWLDIVNTKADMIDDAIRITVLQSDYYGTGKMPWNGAVVLPHRWRLEPAAQNTIVD